MIASILDACRDQLCSSAAFRGLVGAADATAARAFVVRLDHDGDPLTTAHAVLSPPSVRWTNDGHLAQGEATVEASLVFPAQGATPAAQQAWAIEAIYAALNSDLALWDDDRRLLLRALVLDPPVLLDAGEDLPGWFDVELTWTWMVAP